MSEPAVVVSDEAPVVEAVGLSLVLDGAGGAFRPVEGVDLELAPGRMLGVVGESGCGKTMLLRALMGLLPSRRARLEGSLRVCGVDVVAASEAERRRLWGREVAMVFQDPMTALNPVVPIGAQVAEGLRVHLGLNRRAARARAAELLEAVGIPDATRRLRSYPHELSGGQRQRVVLAIAIACGPRLLLADEPTTGLDVTIQAQILELLDELRVRHRMAVVLVSHDLAVVSGRADEVAVMYAGRIVEHGPTDAVFSAPRMRYTAALIRSRPDLDAPAGALPRGLDGGPPDLHALPPGCRFAPRCEAVDAACTSAEPRLEVDPALASRRFRCVHPVGSA